MPEFFDLPHTVADEEIDEQGHANNVVYVQWMQAAAIAHSATLGWTGQRYRQIGCGWVVRSHWIEYHCPAQRGEQILIRTWVAGMKKVTSVRRYRILRAADLALLAEAETNWAFIDYATGHPVRIPQEIIQAYPAAGQKLERGRQPSKR